MTYVQFIHIQESIEFAGNFRCLERFGMGRRLHIVSKRNHAVFSEIGTKGMRPSSMYNLMFFSNTREGMSNGRVNHSELLTSHLLRQKEESRLLKPERNQGMRDQQIFFQRIIQQQAQHHLPAAVLRIIFHRSIKH